MKIYQCNTCGNIIAMVEDKSVVPSCCGSQMTLLAAKSEDEGMEKHVPVVSREGNEVKVFIGSTMHPMTEAHRIEWVLLETDNSFQVQYLKDGDTPAACFTVAADAKLKTVYSYCNLHGLWEKKMT